MEHYRSKHMYEVIYNRIISNLLLWTPSAPSSNKQQQSQQPHIDATNPFLNMNMTDSGSMPFSMAKSNIFFGKLDSLTKFVAGSIKYSLAIYHQH